MIVYDSIIIGGGFAGLMAAAVAAKRGKKVVVMTKGAGTLAIGGGVIDILGYVTKTEPIQNPTLGLAQLPPSHPYSKIGQQGVTDAVAFFLEMCKEEGYEYVGDLEHTVWLPTAAGTFKPSCLVPKTMNPTGLKGAKQVVVVGFERLKDYFPEVIRRGLGKRAGYEANYETVMIDSQFAVGRDVTALDIARWLDTAEGQQACIAQMRTVIKPGSVVLIPPVLGTHPTYRPAEIVEKALGCRFIELAGMPPAITGLRLRNLLVNYVKKQGVKIIEQANVIQAVVEKGQCRGVTTTNFDRERHYQAKHVVLATGGFFGGGLQSGPGYVKENIFNLPITGPIDQELWGNKNLFSDCAQPFAMMGIEVDSTLRPVNVNGQPLLQNVHIAGRNLAGYDYCFEKSGNGVALVSGYKAGMTV